VEEKKYLTVSALTKYIKYKFDQDKHLKNVLLKGEISNFKHHSRGHFYFTLKDDKAQISAIMFASNSKDVKFRPTDGMSVLVEGYLTVYEVGGRYQIYVTNMSEDGLGNLYVAYEQLKKKLSEEGLFDQRHKKPIPKFPKAIGVLTSPTGAAVRDIIHIVNRRYPLSKIIVYPTLVQGEFAKDSIIAQIKKANKQNIVDVIILGRGGGSIEDLWPFNEEQVAYEIFKSTIPIISSVGHETDFTISDFVADLRAPTPSGGAELAVPNRIDLIESIKGFEYTLTRSIERILIKKTEQLHKIEDSYIFRDPLRITEQVSRKLDSLSNQLRVLHPGKKLEQANERVKRNQQLLNLNAQKILKEKQNQLLFSLNKLELLNPLSIMKKGYSVSKVNGKVITNVLDVKIGDEVKIQVNNGEVISKVLQIRKDE
jgi:exodeoxyribonuclease VII large subunit